MVLQHLLEIFGIKLFADGQLNCDWVSECLCELIIIKCQLISVYEI